MIRVRPQGQRSVPGSVGYISIHTFIEPTTIEVPSGFSGYIGTYGLKRKYCV